MKQIDSAQESNRRVTSALFAPRGLGKMGTRTHTFLHAASLCLLIAAPFWMFAAPSLGQPGLIGVFGFNVGFARPAVGLYYLAAVVYSAVLVLSYYTVVQSRLPEITIPIMAAALSFACLSCALYFADAWVDFCYEWLSPGMIVPSVNAKGLPMLLVFAFLWAAWFFLLRRRCQTPSAATPDRRFLRAMTLVSLIILLAAIGSFMHLLGVMRQLDAGISYCWFGPYTGIVLSGTVFLWTLALGLRGETCKTAATTE